MGAETQVVQKNPQIPAPAVPKDIKVSETVEELKLPKSDAVVVNADPARLTEALGQQNATAYSQRFQQVSAQMTLVKDHSYFLTNANIDSYSKVLNSSMADISKALEAKDEKALNNALSKLENKLQSLEKFINYEKTQGLAGTHAESGVRIYIKNNKVYLCTPDQKAFRDVLTKPQEAEQLQQFVQRVAGISAIDFAKSQNTETKDGITLLSCRLDSVSEERGQSQFKLRTQLRVSKEDEKWQGKWVEITFSLSDLQNGALKKVEGFNGPGKLPDVNLNTGGPSGFNPAVPGLFHHRALLNPNAANEAIIPRGLTRRVTSATEKVASPLRSARENLGSYRQVTALKTIAEERVNIKGFKLDEFDTPEKIAAKLKEVESKSSGFHKAVERRVAQLQEQLKAEAPGSVKAKKYQGQIDSLRELADTEITNRQQLLEKQLATAPDDATKLAAKKGLVKIKDDVLAAYDRQIAKTTGATQKGVLETAKSDFDTKVKVYETEVPKSLGTRVSAWVDKNLPTVKRLFERIRSVGNKDINVLDSFWKKLEARSAARAQKCYDSSTSTLSETATDSAAVTKQLKSLDGDGAVIDRRLAALERQRTKGIAGLDDQITKLKDRSTEITLKRKELLERQIMEAGDSPTATKLKTRLYDEMGQKIEDAHRHKGQATEADDFVNKRTQHKEQAEARKREVILLDNHPEVAKTVRARQAAEKALADAPDGTPLKLEKQAALDLASSKEQVARQKAKLQQLGDDLYHDPNNAALKVEVDKAKADLDQVTIKEKKAQADLTKCKRDSVVGDIAEIEKKLADTGIDEATRKKLETDKVKAKVKQAELDAELGVKQNATGFSHDYLKELNTEIKKLEESLAAEKNPDAQAKIKDEIAKLTQEANKERAGLIEAEVKTAKASKTQMQAAIDDVDAQIKKLAPGDAKIKELQQVKKHLEGKIKGLDTTVEYFEGQAKIVDLEQQVAKKQAALTTEKQKLAATPDDAALKQAVGALDTELNTLKTNLAATQKQFNSTWTQRLANAKAGFATRVNAMKDYARRNPVKAGVGMAMMAEGVRGSLMASYEDDAKHPMFIPSLLYSLSKNPEDYEMETKDLGIIGAGLAEFTSTAGNTAIVASGIIGGQKLLAVTAGRTALGSKVGQVLLTKAAGRVLVGVGAGVDGFLSFSNGDFTKDNDRQLVVRTASPILIGAGFGAFFGPPGAVIGAAAGAVGELGGALYYLGTINSDFDENMKKRSVRDSIKMAEQGFVHLENSSIVQNRGPLSSEENEAIETLSRQALLNSIFSKDSKLGFSKDELLAAGFRVASEGASQEEQMEVGEHNWDRAKQLLEGRAGYNPRRLWSGDYIDQLRDSHPDVANKFQNVHRQCREHYDNLYRTSMRVSYDSWSDRSKVIISNEFSKVMPQVAKDFAIAFKAKEAAAKTPEERAKLSQEQWEFIARRIPQFGKIMSDQVNARGAFINNFNQHLPAGMPKFNDCAIWKEARYSEMGLGVMLNSGDIGAFADPVLRELENFKLPQS